MNKKDHSGNYFAASIGLVMISGILMFFNPLISMSAAITGISTALLGDRKSTLISKKNEKQMEKTKKELNKLYK
ncbi:MAG: hypothetical protein KKH40_05585 [Nanoarchaeota archaeon]|nr:hypothetical protein [Nanoarchaeota archaeon]